MCARLLICMDYRGGVEVKGKHVLVIQLSLYISVSFCQVKPNKDFIAMQQLQHKAWAFSY